MRKLKTADVPEFCRVVKALGIKEFLRDVAQKADTGEDLWNSGFEILWGLFDIITENGAEQRLYEFLSRPLEMTAEAIANMDLTDFAAAMKRLAEENDLISFFKLAVGAMK